MTGTHSMSSNERLHTGGCIMAIRAKLLLTVGISFVFMGAACAEGTFCPKVISVKQEITSIPPSWETFAETLPYQLKLVSFFEGHPKNRVALVNDTSEVVEKNEVAIWNFVSSTKGYWIECGYDQTNITLTQRLANKVSQCRVTYDRDLSISGAQAIKEINCR